MKKEILSILILIAVVMMTVTLKEYFSVAENIAGERLNNNIFFSIYPTGAPYWTEIANPSLPTPITVSYLRRTGPRYLYRPQF